MNPVTRILRFLNHNRDIMGIMDGSLAFQAPQIVQIDLTNRCNNDCIACWCRSPLLGDKALAAEYRDQTLTFKTVIALIDDLHKIGCPAVFLAGSGEPMLHPRIMDILSHIKVRGLRCHLNTNFTLVDHEKAEQFHRIGLDEITISLWAATPDTYVLTHPNKSASDYQRIIDMITYLNKIRMGHPPRLKIYHVISNLNYHEVGEMARQAVALGVETIEFTIVDTIPERTDSLLPNPQQASEILQQCAELATDPILKTSNLQFSQFEVFKGRVQNLLKGEHDFERGIVNRTPCYIGWLFSRILPDGNVNGCLKAHRIPIGNLYATSFRELWNSKRQRDFRRRTFAQNSDDPLFTFIGNDPDAANGCLRSCDDIGRNTCLHERMQKLDPLRKLCLGSTSKLWRMSYHLADLLTPNRW